MAPFCGTESSRTNAGNVVNVCVCGSCQPTDGGGGGASTCAAGGSAGVCIEGSCAPEICCADGSCRATKADCPVRCASGRILEINKHKYHAKLYFQKHLNI